MIVLDVAADAAGTADAADASGSVISMRDFLEAGLAFAGVYDCVVSDIWFSIFVHYFCAFTLFSGQKLILGFHWTTNVLRQVSWCCPAF